MCTLLYYAFNDLEVSQIQKQIKAYIKSPLGGTYVLSIF